MQRYFFGLLNTFKKFLLKYVFSSRFLFSSVILFLFQRKRYSFFSPKSNPNSCKLDMIYLPCKILLHLSPLFVCTLCLFRPVSLHDFKSILLKATKTKQTSLDFTYQLPVWMPLLTLCWPQGKSPASLVWMEGSFPFISQASFHPCYLFQIPLMLIRNNNYNKLNSHKVVKLALN